MCVGSFCRDDNINMNSKIFGKMGWDQGLRVSKEWGWRRFWRLMMGTITHKILLTRKKRGETNYLPKVGVPIDPIHSRHG